MPRRKLRKRPFLFLTNKEGVDEQDGDFVIAPSAAELIQNMHVDKYSEFTTHDQGYADFTAELESGARIDGLRSYTDTSDTSYILAAVNGKVLNINADSGANDGTITTANTASNLIDAATIGDSVYITEKTMTPQKWSGSGSSTAVSGIPLTHGGATYSQPALATTYANRLAYANFQGGTVYPSHMILSDTGAPDTFTLSPGTNDTDAVIVEVNPGDGQSIKALRQIYIPALDENYLVAWKDSSTHALTGTTPSTMAVLSLSGSFGCLNNNCHVEVGGDVLFIDRKNIYSLRTSTESGNLQTDIIGSDKVRTQLQNMNVSQLDKSWAVHIPSRHEVWFGIPTGSSTEVDTILVYNYRNQKRGDQVWTIRKGMDATAALVLGEKLFTGRADGFVSRWFNSSEYDGVGIDWVYRYPYFDFDAQFQYKQIVECFAFFKLRNTTTITFKTKWRHGGNDTTNSFTKTITGPGTAEYGTAVYGTDTYAGFGNDVVKVKIPVLGNGEQLQLEVSGTNDSVGVTFLGFKGLVEYGNFTRDYL